MPASRLEVRHPQFDLSGASVPRHWHTGRKSVTTFFDNLSIFFPLGERFFIRAVTAHRDHVTDPALVEDVRSFCRQEGAHGSVHDRYNRMLTERGYPAAHLERRVARLLDRASWLLSKRAQLAATCALEHFTALMGQALLEDDRVLEGAHPVMSALWRWHAAEENEHKSVAYDVYRAAGGTYVERVLVMLLVTPIFWGKVLEHQARLMAVDGTLWSAREWTALFRYLFVTPGTLRRLVPPYLDYFRPSFHPSDADAPEALAKWRDDYASSPEYRRAG